MVAQWPGSTHDSYIWHNSGLKQLLTSGVISQRVYLLGDSGYPLELKLMTPYCNPSNPPERLYNIKHKRARNIIEKCFGLLKQRFRMLGESGGKILYDPPTTTRLIIAASVLHNICILCGVPFDQEEENDDDCSDNDYDDSDDNDDIDDTVPSLQARLLRDEIALRFQAAR